MEPKQQRERARDYIGLDKDDIQNALGFLSDGQNFLSFFSPSFSFWFTFRVDFLGRFPLDISFRSRMRSLGCSGCPAISNLLSSHQGDSLKRPARRQPTIRQQKCRCIVSRFARRQQYNHIFFWRENQIRLFLYRPPSFNYVTRKKTFQSNWGREEANR